MFDAILATGRARSWSISEDKLANCSLASVLIYLDDEIRAGGRKRAPFPAYAPTIDKTGNAQLHRRNSDLHNGGQCRHPINRNNFEDGSSVPAKQQQSNDRQKKKRKECGDRPQPSVGKSSECDGGKSYKGKPAGVVDQADCNISRLKYIRPIGCEGAHGSMRYSQTGEDRPGDFSRPSHLIPLQGPRRFGGFVIRIKLAMSSIT